MKTKGFTLIDILISVAIVSFLSSIVLFNTTEARKKAEDSKMQAEAGQVALALEMYKLSNNGATPISVRTSSSNPILGAELGVIYKEDTNTTQYEGAINELVTNGYLARVPRSPDGESYAYGESLDGRSAVFVIRTNTRGNICITMGDSNFGRTGTGNSCEGILNTGEETEEDPYTYYVSGYQSITLIPLQTYTFIYEGNGDEMNFMVNGQHAIQSWIAENQLTLLGNNGYNCSFGSYCIGESNDAFEFISFDSSTLTLKVIYYTE